MARKGKAAGNSVVLRNKKSQRLMPKGLMTRDRIIANTLDAIAKRPMTAVSITEIAVMSEISAPAFYNYFDDIPEIILERLWAMVDEPRVYIAIAAQIWPDGAAYAKIRALVDSYAEYGHNNRPALNYRNMMCDQGDERFLEVRRQVIVYLVRLLTVRIEESQRRGHASPTMHAPSAAAASLALIDRVTSMSKFPYGNLGWTTEGYLDSAARMVELLLGEQGGFDAAKAVVDAEWP